MSHLIPSRRTLLQLASAGAVTAALTSRAVAQEGPPEAEGQPMPGGVDLPRTPPEAPRSDSVGVAVVGLGGYALGQMLPAFTEADGIHVAALVSGNRDKALRVARAYGVPEDAVYGYDDFAQIESDDRVKAVYIVLPSGLHAAWTEKAFAAGKHVLCEKPMALSVAECRRMIDAGAAADRKLMIAYRIHFEPTNLAAMELATGGEIGPMRTVRTSHCYRAGAVNPEENWRFNRALAGGGPLEDYGIYGLQAAMYMTGEVPESVFGSTLRPEGDPRFREIFAQATAELRFPSGAIGQIETAYDAAGLNAVIARGRDGVVTIEPATSYGGLKATLKTGGGPRPVEAGPASLQFSRMLEHFASAIRDGEEIRTPGEMGLRDVAVIEAIYRSAKSGKAEPVRT